MRKIECPHCKKVFTVDESEYAELLNQVKNDSFREELNRRLAEIQKTMEAEQKTALSELARTNDNIVAEKEVLIQRLQQQLEESNKSINSQVELAVAKKAEELNEAYTIKERQLNQQLSEKSTTITELNAKIAQGGIECDMAVMRARQEASDLLQQSENRAKELLQEKSNEIIRLKNDAKLIEQQAENKILTLQAKYEERISQNAEQHKLELKLKDEVIAQYKDFKAKQSTKMIGESLEVYCNNQFELNVHPYLPTAVFKKDTQTVEGTKGDFVFRDVIDEIESVSIMFEMKNEADNTLVKQKNSDFFKKLDSDRTKKNCEYAVLVSLLELDNDLYNNGIYVVPGYEKMYVVRPQQFLTIISLLVQTGRKTVEVKKELAAARNREIDVTHFEEKIDNFKMLFGKHVQDAASRYNKAIEDIDKSIENLNKMKEDLRLWVEHLYKADKNFEDLTIRKLTYNNPTMKAKINEARGNNSYKQLPD